MPLEVTEHFKEEERPFIEKALDDILFVQHNYTPVLQTFLNPREQYILQTLINRYEDVHVQFDGGYKEAERQRALLFPNYFEVDAADFELTFFSIQFPQKFEALKHGQILGAVLGAGIVRERVGDIVTDGKSWQIITDQGLADFIRQNVKQVGRVTVDFEEIERQHVLEPQDAGEVKEVVVSSMRLDVIISRAFNLSRQLAQTFIKRGRVRINWTEELNPATILERYDTISVRKYGRVRVGQRLRRTRKDHTVLEVKVTASNH